MSDTCPSPFNSVHEECRETLMIGYINLFADPYYVERKGLYIGQGTTMLSRAGIFRVSEGVAVDMVHRVYKLPSFRDLLEGEIFLQNLPSIITAHALDPREGERILDMCAAPGGKTTAIAILMKDKGEVIAVDRSHNKVFEIQKLAAEMGLKCITTYKLDALRSVQRMSESDRKDTPQCGEQVESNEISDSSAAGIEEMSSTAIGGTQATLEQLRNENRISKAELRKNNRKLKNGPGRNNCLGGRVEKSKGFPPNSFDRVLLDAPCSALGLRPRLFAGEVTVESLRTHATYQRRMFDQAVQLVRPGGVIVYSTCTINPGENEALVRYALDTYKFLSLASQFPRVGGPGLVGCYQFSDGYKEEWLRHGEEDLVQRFDPSSSLDTIGFFIAKFSVGSKDV
ncbi:NOL1/NOP2/sun family protein [Forsythia ovata]|uniref:NOL1/NOP2/sun family protein n=1 Tax=Forsythia ovata TaxID=205694 RepID=A0ABD1S188_9LAMI